MVGSEEENNHDKEDISNILESLPLLLWGKSTNEGRHFFFSSTNTGE